MISFEPDKTLHISLRAKLLYGAMLSLLLTAVTTILVWQSLQAPVKQTEWFLQYGKAYKGYRIGNAPDSYIIEHQARTPSGTDTPNVEPLIEEIEHVTAE
jgi:type II secretory pathway component PulM